MDNKCCCLLFVLFSSLLVFSLAKHQVNLVLGSSDRKGRYGTISYLLPGNFKDQCTLVLDYSYRYCMTSHADRRRAPDSSSRHPTMPRRVLGAS